MIRLVAWTSNASGAIAAVGALLRPRHPALTWVATVVGVGALLAIVALQWLLIGGVLSFEVQVGQVSIALLIIGAWFVVTGVLGRRSRLLPRGGRMGLLAATYVGYPIWAFWFGRLLSGLSGDPVSIPGARAERYLAAARKENP